MWWRPGAAACRAGTGGAPGGRRIVSHREAVSCKICKIAQKTIISWRNTGYSTLSLLKCETDVTSSSREDAIRSLTNTS